jgi:hypothetical protein
MNSSLVKPKSNFGSFTRCIPYAGLFCWDRANGDSTISCTQNKFNLPLTRMPFESVWHRFDFLQRKRSHPISDSDFDFSVNTIPTWGKNRRQKFQTIFLAKNAEFFFCIRARFRPILSRSIYREKQEKNSARIKKSGDHWARHITNGWSCWRRGTWIRHLVSLNLPSAVPVYETAYRFIRWPSRGREGS